jgi:hypothetical protein
MKYLSIKIEGLIPLIQSFHSKELTISRMSYFRNS